MIPAAFKTNVTDVQKNLQIIKKAIVHNPATWDPSISVSQESCWSEAAIRERWLLFPSTFPNSLKCFSLTVANQETYGEWGSRKHNSQLHFLYFPIYFQAKHLSLHCNDSVILLLGSIVSIIKLATNWHHPHLFGLPPFQLRVTKGRMVT